MARLNTRTSTLKERIERLATKQPSNAKDMKTEQKFRVITRTVVPDNDTDSDVQDANLFCPPESDNQDEEAQVQIDQQLQGELEMQIKYEEAELAKTDQTSRDVAKFLAVCREMRLLPVPDSTTTDTASNRKTKTHNTEREGTRKQQQLSSKVESSSDHMSEVSEEAANKRKRRRRGRSRTLGWKPRNGLKE